MKQRFLYVIGLIVILNINLFDARDYSPETGRWTAEDPIGFWSGDINFYAYCANDPVNYIDPSGLSKEGKDGLKKIEWVYGRFKSPTKWTNQFAKRGWTKRQIDEAISKGKQFKAKNNVNKANSATRYVHPKTGKSAVIDDVTNELLHIGGAGYEY